MGALVTLSARIVAAPRTTAVPTEIPSVANAAALRLLEGNTTTIPVATARGMAAEGDGGGGSFYWSTVPGVDDGWDVLNAGTGSWNRIGAGRSVVGSTPIARRVIIDDPRPINLRDCGGAMGNAENVDSALTLMFQRMKAQRKSALIPMGHYRFTSTLALELSDSDDVTQLAIVGDNAADEVFWAAPVTPGIHPNHTILEWDGSTKQNMVKLRGRGMRIAGITFRAKPGRAVDACIDIDSPDDNSAGKVGSRIFIERCVFVGNPGGGYGSVDFGVALGRENPAYGNLEDMVFTECLFQSLVEGGIYNANTSGQSKSTSITRCRFNGTIDGIDDGKFAIKQFNGSIQTSDACSIGHMAEAAIQYLASPYDTLKFEDLNCEALYQFLTLGVTTDPCPVKICNCRFAITDNVNGDGRFIVWSGAGPFRIEGTAWEYGGTYDPEDIHILHATTVPARLKSEGNAYMSSDPIRSISGGGLMGLTYDTLADVYRQSGVTTFIPSALNVETP